MSQKRSRTSGMQHVMMFGPFHRVNIPTRNASRLLCMSNQVQNQNPFKATTTGKQSKTKLVFQDSSGPKKRQNVIAGHPNSHSGQVWQTFHYVDLNGPEIEAEFPNISKTRVIAPIAMNLSFKKPPIYLRDQTVCSVSSKYALQIFRHKRILG